MHKDSVVILGAARTPQGKLLGALKQFSATELGTIAMKAALQKSQLPAAIIQDVFMGCVLPAGLGQAPARQAAIGAGLSTHTRCVTINKVCGSGMQSVIFAHDSILANSTLAVIAGGMESMSNAPFLLPQARQGYRLGEKVIWDHLMHDGLEDAYAVGCSMGELAEKFAQAHQFSRQQQDDYALRSVERARLAIQDQSFTAEISPIEIASGSTTTLMTTDEHPYSVNLDKIRLLPPAFAKNGTITAANASAIADGAAAIVVTHAKLAEQQGLAPLAKIVGHASFAKAPADYITAPIDAIKCLLDKINWKISDVDLFEINEAFAIVALAAMRDLNIPVEKLNLHGGACALGHPIGATGARLLATLIYALKKHGLKKGIAALCIGGGEATAIAIEII